MAAVAAERNRSPKGSQPDTTNGDDCEDTVPAELQPLKIHLSPEALEVLNVYREELEPQLLPYGPLDHVAAFVGKLHGAIVRIAGWLHLAAEDDPERWRLMISENTMTVAVALGRYYLAHAIGVADYIGTNPILADAQVLLHWAAHEDRGGSFTKREAHHADYCRFTKVIHLDEPLAELVDRGWIRRAVAENPPAGVSRRARGTSFTPTL